VYDPTSGELRSHSTDDIACWFIDTNYDGESFFVRHAYSCGEGEPYEKLKKALRAEINEAEWAKLYSTRSQPFDPPSTPGGSIHLFYAIVPVQLDMAIATEAGIAGPEGITGVTQRPVAVFLPITRGAMNSGKHDRR
jgi:hypothetical protein